MKNRLSRIARTPVNQVCCTLAKLSMRDAQDSSRDADKQTTPSSLTRDNDDSELCSDGQSKKERKERNKKRWL